MDTPGIVRFLAMLVVITNVADLVILANAGCHQHNDPRNAQRQYDSHDHFGDAASDRVTSANAAGSEADTDRDHCEERKRVSYDALSTWAAIWTAGFTAALFFAAIWVAMWQRDLMRGDLAATRDTLILTHRPQLMVRVVILKYPRSNMLPPPPQWFWPNELVWGQLYVVNLGGTPAHIVDSGCWVHWQQGKWVDQSMSRKLARVDAGGQLETRLSDGFAGYWDNPLPMERPYEGKNGNIGPYGTITPGGSKPLEFLSDRRMGDEGRDIFSGGNGWSLWVMGWIEYDDEARPPNRRRTAFCRVWDPGAQRFFPVDDLDYEHAP